MHARRPRAVAIIAALAVVSTACGAPDDAAAPAGVPTASESTATGHASALEALPDEVGLAPETSTTLAAAPAAPDLPEVTPVELPATVEVHRPDLVVRIDDAPASALYGALAVPGVDQLSAASEFTATLTTFDGEMREVSVLAVDHATFRPLTPEITANAAGVWQRLAEGDILVRHDIAHELEIPLGGEVDLSSTEGQLTARVGAFASNGAPPLADIVVPWDIGSRLGDGDINALIVAVDAESRVAEVAGSLTDVLGGGDVETREAPVEQKAAKLAGAGARTHFEPFTFTDLGDGQIVIDPNWTRKWITTIELPGLGRTSCHRMMVPQLFKALEEVQAAGLYDHFERDQFAGCWVARHIDWNPSKPLSMHAWGLAIDFNSRDNWLGDEPQMDMRIVEIFEKWGFEWGGRWRRPDGMHFELDRVIEMS